MRESIFHMAEDWFAGLCRVAGLFQNVTSHFLMQMSVITANSQMFFIQDAPGGQPRTASSASAYVPGRNERSTPGPALSGSTPGKSRTGLRRSCRDRHKHILIIRQQSYRESGVLPHSRNNPYLPDVVLKPDHPFSIRHGIH